MQIQAYRGFFGGLALFTILTALSGGVGAAPGNGNGKGQDDGSGGDSGGAAPYLSFAADRTEVLAGESVSLSWASLNTKHCFASADWSGKLATDGTYTTGPLDGPKTYILECKDGGSTVSATVWIAVSSADAEPEPEPALEPEPTAPPTLALSVADYTLASGGSTTLSWTTTDADSCSASGGWSGSKAASGSESTGAINTDTAFTLSCSGPGGSVSDSVGVSIAAQPTVDLNAAESVVAVGGSTELSWSSSNADLCTASGGWSGEKAAAGTQSVGPLEQSTTYSLSCSGTGGTTMDMISVSINDQVSLTWQAPQENEDGSALTDLAGYRVYYGLTSGNYTDSLSIDSSDATSHSMTLSSGSYYFAMTAVDADGNESGYSNEVVKSVD